MRWRKFLLLAFCLFLSHQLGFAQHLYKSDLIRDIQPEGWIRTFLERQKSGMTGHPEAMSYPYDSNLWNGEIVRNTTSYGSDWWRYEQTAYYTDGLLRLGYLLNDSVLIAKAEEGIIYTLSNADENGKLPHTTFRYGSHWPMAVFFRAIRAYYEQHNDERIPNILENHYLSIPIDEIKKWRNIITIEGMLWTYEKTGNKELLKRSEEAWQSGEFSDLTPEACFEPMTRFMHGVTFCEELKLPLLLWAYTKNQFYLDAALNAYGVMERDHMLPDGVQSSAEALLGNGNIINSHETCDVTDLTWTLGHFLEATGDPIWADRLEKAVFNAGPGSVTKDFKALQYFSSVNQFRVTGDSNHNGFFYGSTWMAYRPTHQTECCAGNVHRFMPNYASKMWMRGTKDEVVAALYGPSSLDYTTSNGANVKIVEDTNYPFDGRITFRFSSNKQTKIKFSFRIPEWANAYSIKLNNKRLSPKKIRGDLFKTVEINIKDKSELVLDFPMEAKLKVLGVGCFAYDEVADAYYEGRGGANPISIEKSDLSVEERGEKNIQSVYVQRGPLVYSYAIPQNKTEDTTEYKNMNGKVSANPDFKSWSIEPAGPWNYAVDLKSEIVLEVKYNESDSYPFELGTDVVRIKFPVKEIEWNLKEGRFTPEVPTPESVKVINNDVKYIELVPYGSTELRLTVFPIIK